MRKSFIRLAVVALLATTGVAIASSPALASPSGIGWSGSWEYTSTSALTVSEKIPGASLSATGTDTGSSRTFSVSLTDTNAGDGLCAYVTWWDGNLKTDNQTCNGTISFTPPSEDGDVDAYLCILNPNTNGLYHCNHVDPPATTGANAFIRQAGYGFEYSYHTPNDYSPENWDATVLLGQVWYDVAGFDNWGSTYGRMLENNLYTFSTGTFVCASGQLLSSSPASSVQLCGPNQSAAGPTGVTTTQYGSGIMACSWATIVRIGGTIVKNCIAASVPMPY